MGGVGGLVIPSSYPQTATKTKVNDFTFDTIDILPHSPTNKVENLEIFIDIKSNSCEDILHPRPSVRRFLSCHYIQFHMILL